MTTRNEARITAPLGEARGRSAAADPLAGLLPAGHRGATGLLCPTTSSTCSTKLRRSVGEKFVPVDVQKKEVSDDR